LFRDDRALLIDIALAARRAAAFRGPEREAFLADPKSQAAVLLQILRIDEAVRMLTPRFRIRHPALPWRSAASQQQPLLGGHAAPYPAAIWKTASTDVPRLRAFISPLLPRPRRRKAG
jgi:uncharacterized protein with HEPN domain